jgi:cobalamin biosynthesis protein CobC
MSIPPLPEAARRTLFYHGGDLASARRLFPDAPQPWIDLSTGVNPHPYPIPEISADAWTRLPDPSAIARLEAVAATRYRVRARADVVAAPGSQAIIQALARLLPMRRVGVLGATYPGHARAWSADVVRVERIEQLADCDVAVVVNPNNPDGRIVASAALLDLAAGMNGRALIVDEAFADFDAAEQSLAPALPERGVIVLRSFGKTYGLAGLRLGFAIAPPDLAAPLRAALGPWAVSGPAIEIGLRALPDQTWFESMRARVKGEAARLDRLLMATGWTVIGGTTLFRLASRADASERFAALLRAGLLTRPFEDAPDRLRFGLPANEEAWERLTKALDYRAKPEL